MNLANKLTIFRIILVPIMVIIPFLGIQGSWNYIPYEWIIIDLIFIIASITDKLDGTIARKTGTANEFGSRLDTLADIAFVVVCMIKLFPVLIIPTWLCIWIGVIAIIKVFNIISEYILQKKFAAKHTLMNKVTGVVLFILPLTLSIVDLKYSGGFVCTIAILAAVQEGHLIRTENHKFKRS